MNQENQLMELIKRLEALAKEYGIELEDLND